MRDRVRRLRNLVSEKAFSVGDRARDACVSMRSAEMRSMKRLYFLLPTPANLVGWASGTVYRFAFLLSDNCPKCDCLRCRCVVDVMEA